jgi:signal transduction histidine kinase
LQIQPRHFPLLSVFLLGTFTLAMIALYALPADSQERTIVARGAGVIVALTMMLSVLRMPAELRPVWFFFWLYLATTVTADLIIFYQEKAQDAAPGPGLADAVYLSSYGFAFAGLARLARRSTSRQQVDVAIDAAIIGLAVLALVYSLIIGPLIAQAETVNPSLMVAIAYPVLDIFVLAALVRVLVLSNQRNPAILLLSAALLAFMLIDLGLSYTAVHGAGSDIEPPWLTALAMIALAASLPSARDRLILATEEGEHLTLLRAALVALAVLLPLALAVQDLWTGQGIHAFWTIIIGTVVTVLVLFRAYRLVSMVQMQRSELELLLQQESKARQEAVEARRAAEAASIAKNDFLSVMSHELRTPLTVIQGMYQLIEISKVPDTVKNYAAKGMESSLHLLKLIEDILDFSNIEAGSFSVVRAPFRIGALLDEMRDEIAGLRQDGVELRFDLEEDLREMEFLGDAPRLKKILINLASNALNFTTRGSVVVSVKRSGGTHETPVLEFAVTDTGIGLTPDQQSRLFQPFTQLDMSSTRRHGGVGMGLVISQRLVRLLGGEPIKLESRAGDGSRFAFRMALCVA